MPGTLDRTSWTFVSGVIAVMETRLLTDDEYLDLMRLPNLQTLLQRIKEDETYVDMPVPEHPDEATAVVERQFVHNVRKLASQSPGPRLAELTFINYMFAELRAFVRAQLTEDEEVPGELNFFTRDELDALWIDSISARENLLDLVGEVRLALAASYEPLRLADLVVDRAELRYFMRRAAQIDSSFIHDWATLYVRLKAALAIIRARLLGEAPEVLVERFLAAPMDDEWLLELATEDLDRMPDVLSRGFEPIEGEVPELSRATVGGLSRMMDDRLTEEMKPARRIAFGPERFFGYAWALHIENFNLRLITETLVVEGDRDHTRARLRMSYV